MEPLYRVISRRPQCLHSDLHGGRRIRGLLQRSPFVPACSTEVSVFCNRGQDAETRPARDVQERWSWTTWTAVDQMC